MSEQNRTWLWVGGGCAGCGCLALVLAAFFFALGFSSVAREEVEGPNNETPDVRALEDDALIVLGDGEILSVEAVAGGEKVQHRLKDGGVLPAEDERARVEAAGFGFQPGGDGEYGLFWQFTVTCRRDDLTEVLVEDVTVPSGIDPERVDPIPVVHDQAPSLEGGRWQGASPAYVIGRDVFPWFYSDDKTGRVFRLTLRFADGSVSRLHQRAEFSGEVKAGVREQLRQAGWSG